MKVADEIETAIIAAMVARFGEKNVFAMIKHQKEKVIALAAVLRFVEVSKEQKATAN